MARREAWVTKSLRGRERRCDLRGVENDDRSAHVGVDQQSAQRAKDQSVVVRTRLAGAFGVAAADDAVHVVQAVLSVFVGAGSRHSSHDAV